MKHDAWTLPGEAVDDRQARSCGDRFSEPNPQLPGSRVGKEFDIFDALPEFIEHGNSSLNNRASILRRLNASRATIDESHAERVFEVRNRSRNCRLRGAE